MTDRWRRLLPRLADVLIVVAIFWVSTAAGARYLADRKISAIGDFLEHGSMVACGYGMTQPAEPRSRALYAFMIREQHAITCPEVVGQGEVRDSRRFAANHRNLIYSVAAALRVGGLSWSTLDLFVGGLFGVSMVLVYGLLRLLVWRGLAVIGVTAIIASNHIAQIANLRDFFKEPWFLAAWLSIGWLIIRRGERATSRLYLPAIVGGLIVGIGIGFRVDLMACAPVFPMVTMLVVAGWDRQALRVKGIAVAGFTLAFAVTALPTLLSLAGGSNSGHVAVLGLMRPFAVELGLEPPPYDIGDIYSDGYARSLIAAHASVVHQQPRETAMGTPEYDARGYAIVREQVEAFPSDQFVRVIGAVRQIVRYPFTKVSREAYVAEDLFPAGALKSAAEWRARAFAPLDGYAIALALAAVALLYALDWRVGAALTLMVFYFCGYSMIQFSRRHTFHFDVIPVAFLMIVIQGVVVGALGIWRSAPPGLPAWPVLARRATVGLSCAAGIAALLALSLWGARSWQQSHLTAMFDRTLQIPWDQIEVSREPISLVHDGVLEPTWYDIDRVSGGIWRGPLTLIRVELAEPASPDATLLNRWAYLRLEVGGAGCAADLVPVALKYTATIRNVDWEYARVFDVPVRRDATSSVVTPVLYRLTASAFEGFLVPRDLAGCVVTAYRSGAGATVPMPIVAAVLPADWKRLPLYARLAP
ncbi:MAG TPA: hypothetical protein VNT81_05615 [Vicinamibacterales bacterium]|nr:hypothetical protein [Vicinamibacterales bacterium]